ncbi:snapalysin family zinc-dependent metalloprotease [Streptomyces sp. ODS28]|uniref:snapalysin family zinc-dependent metalloprotease n=1 Tax=Streptomyces sp. ODS28 TaxID=3136688 RepID=UPI0031E76944
MRHQSYRKSALAGASALGLAAALGLGALGSVPTAHGEGSQAAASPARAAQAHALGFVQGGHGGYKGEDRKATKAFMDAIRAEVAKQQAAHPGIQQVTVNYDPSKAPKFKSQIANAASVWNGAQKNVQLKEGSGGFEYREGDDPRGSYASTDGHGKGFVFLDYKQNEEYDSNRVVAHETGHVLGLPDHYEGPCEELMSGGGPGPSCKNDQPNAAEKQKVDELWANGYAPTTRP